MLGKTITNNYSVEGQITPDQTAKIAAAGFKSIMCNRPDDEEPDQTHFSAIALAAKKYGMSAVHLPVVSGKITQDNVATFTKMIADLPSPVFAYCRSGTRCTVLWSLMENGKRPANEILERTAGAGYDMSHMLAALKP